MSIIVWEIKFRKIKKEITFCTTSATQLQQTQISEFTSSQTINHRQARSIQVHTTKHKSIQTIIADSFYKNNVITTQIYNHSILTSTKKHHVFRQLVSKHKLFNTLTSKQARKCSQIQVLLSSQCFQPTRSASQMRARKYEVSSTICCNNPRAPGRGT